MTGSRQYLAFGMERYPRRLLLVPALLLVFASSAFGKPNEEADVKAANSLGRLIAWKETPGVLLEQCARMDPEGSATRQEFYGPWALDHQTTLTRVDQYAKDVAPKLFPSLARKGIDPVEWLRAKTFIDLSRDVYFLSPEKTKELCKNFATSPVFYNDRSMSLTNDAFEYLDGWEKENPSASDLSHP